MNIDSIYNGIVLDHIQAGTGMEVYRQLGLERLDCSVAIITNAKSTKMGKKDILKIDSPIDLNLEVLGYLDPDITVDIIREGQLVDKAHLCLPRRLVNTVRCKNPRCITAEESQLDALFLLADAERRVYRCAYCDAEHRR